MHIKKTIFIFIIIYILQFSIISLYPDEAIYLAPIETPLLYNDFFDSLNPFFYSKKTVKLEKDSILKLLDEIDYDNGFYGDILKVEVVQGLNKGMLGYILEENVCIAAQSIKKNVVVFFEDEIIIDEKFKIIKNTRCLIVASKIIDGEEFLNLKFLSNHLTGLEIIYNKKNDLHFIIDKKSEILYHLRKNDNIIKVVDPNNLLPIENAIYNNTASNESGIIYFDNKSTKYIITKNGYTEGIIIPSFIEENIHLCFLDKLDYFSIYDDKEVIYEKSIYKFTIDIQNKSDFKKVGIKILSKDNFSIFGYPLLELNDYSIKGGFYIVDLPKKTNSTCQINLTNDHIGLKYFDEKKLEWININFIRNNQCITLQLLKDGYYILIQKSDQKQNKIKINKDKNFNISKIFFKNIDGDKYFTINNDFQSNTDSKEISIFEDRYESIFFSIDCPDNLIQRNFYYDSSIKYFRFSDLEIKENEKIITKGFSNLYNGIWFRKGIRVNNEVSKNQNKLEHLGNILLESPNKISFINESCVIEGYTEIIDNRMLYIHIQNINTPLIDLNNNIKYYINPSIFNSQLIIPAYYSFKRGILQISFDGIFFKRKKVYNDLSGKNNFIFIESFSSGNPKFPISEEKAFYKLFFTQ